MGQVGGGEAEGGEAGIRGEEVRRVRRKNRPVGRKKRKLDRLQMIVSYSLWLYEILLLTPPSCSPTISRQYGSQESSQDEVEDIH